MVQKRGLWMVTTNESSIETNEYINKSCDDNANESSNVTSNENTRESSNDTSNDNTNESSNDPTDDSQHDESTNNKHQHAIHGNTPDDPGACQCPSSTRVPTTDANARTTADTDTTTNVFPEFPKY